MIYIYSLASLGLCADWRLPLAEKLEEKERERHLQTELNKKFEDLVVASRVLQAVEKFKGLLKHVRSATRMIASSSSS